MEPGEAHQKFAKRLDDEMTYLNTHDGMDITEANKLQFYTEQMLDSTYFDKSIIMKWEKRDLSRKTWEKSTSYFKKWTRREEKYDISAGGTAKKTRFESNQQVRDHQPTQEKCDDSDDIRTNDALREYIDSASAASMAKEERILQMAEEARRAGIDITEANKLHFYKEQMLDSTYFDKSIIMKWEKRDPSRKTWAKATSYFEKMDQTRGEV